MEKGLAHKREESPDIRPKLTKLTMPRGLSVWAEGMPRSEIVTSIGLAPRPVGRALRGLFALLDDRAWVARSIQANRTSAILSLRSAAWPGS
jgi:hypothetical protein